MKPINRTLTTLSFFVVVALAVLFPIITSYNNTESISASTLFPSDITATGSNPNFTAYGNLPDTPCLIDCIPPNEAQPTTQQVAATTVPIVTDNGLPCLTHCNPPYNAP